VLQHGKNVGSMLRIQRNLYKLPARFNRYEHKTEHDHSSKFHSKAGVFNLKAKKEFHFRISIRFAGKAGELNAIFIPNADTCNFPSPKDHSYKHTKTC